jgi:glycosyltransferase involved in cell wall biosynthesis
MIWQILIVTQPSRYEFLRQLNAALTRQILALGLRRSEQVELLTLMTAPGGLFGVGDFREQLRHKATADYICFLDDDDWIAPNYVEKILHELKKTPDYVGFEVLGFHDYTPTKRDFHMLSAGKWFETDFAFWRDISHINPIRRDLAMCVPMSGGFGEDHRWADEMRARKLLKDATYIDEVLYYYLYRSRKNDAMDAHHPARLALIEQTTVHA